MSKFRQLLCTALIAAFGVSGAPALAAENALDPAGKPAAAEAVKEKAAGEASEKRFARDGIVIDFEARPLEGSELMEGKLTELRFRFSDERTGKPVQGVRPGAWMDVGANIQGRAGADQRECKEKIGLYLKGAVGIRPLADLNGYYLLVMNSDSTITVIDPMVSMAGRTSTLQVIKLKKPAIDWANHGDSRRLFVTMPAAGAVAVVDTETFEVVTEVPVGAYPSRIVGQPDGRYFWVGNNGKEEKDSGVTVIDAKTYKVVMQAPTGVGHHEIAVSTDSRYAFVTNRDAGTVSVFDVASLKKVKDIKIGSMPLSIAYSKLSQSAYVSDGKEGKIVVIDGVKHEVVKKIAAKPGLGPLRFTQDGRFGMVVNTAESVVNVIDPGSNEIIHSPKTQEGPYQIVFSRDFAYVRSLGSERVTMINLSSLGTGKEPTVQSFAAGAYAPKLGGDLPLADGLTPAVGEAAAFVVSPAENSSYFYMEGMNAPMSSYQGRGHLGRAVTVIDRSLKETEPGLFVGRMRLPIAGRYDVALSADQPRLVHCFATEAKANPELEKLRQTSNIEFLPQAKIFKPKDVAKMRFKVLDGEGKPKTGLRDAMVRAFLAPAGKPRDVVAREVEKGIYEAPLALDELGAHYVYVGVPSLKIGYNDVGFLTFLVREPTPQGARPAPEHPAAQKAAAGKGE